MTLFNLSVHVSYSPTFIFVEPEPISKAARTSGPQVAFGAVWQPLRTRNGATNIERRSDVLFMPLRLEARGAFAKQFKVSLTHV
ncbi:hypothetical protein D3C87_1627210 [compost metagenome]